MRSGQYFLKTLSCWAVIHIMRLKMSFSSTGCFSFSKKVVLFQCWPACVHLFFVSHLPDGCLSEAMAPADCNEPVHLSQFGKTNCQANASWKWCFSWRMGQIQKRISTLSWFNYKAEVDMESLIMQYSCQISVIWSLGQHFSGAGDAALVMSVHGHMGEAKPLGQASTQFIGRH